ncbi:tRNA lysidine(34) synthetase TilS [Chitinibacter bivalviorum]|uniref:tRNA(Ile)-lysidine synthase n=1 Tax=Chitinibacter bivalviorum TaxID=2739434 RepID=A0A7H9BGS1_9NEIS|nr:tRNA lysidine(34) synthetase TilS [Chitinibacter bivalviorum]QLG87141.1 tRNA lysidine(34) synthetase TilS [Chitinibacter bivalviorum]
MANSKKKPSPKANWPEARDLITRFIDQQQNDNGSFGSRCAFQTPRLSVGLSGGLDSSVLLHFLASLRDELGFALSALHVHHGLSPNADIWAQSAQAFAAHLNVPCQIQHVTLEPNSGYGIEGAARKARYAQYELQACDAIVLAHHQNDQAETVLINLLRGCGPAGLAAMPSQRPLNPHMALLRPLLTLPRSELLSYAQSHDLQWVEDESNLDTQYQRNDIRHNLMPTIMRISPKALTTITRSAIHQSEVNDLLIEIAELDLQQCQSGNSLALEPWLKLSAVRQKNVLRHWLAQAGIVLELRAFNELIRTAIDAAGDTHPALVWRNAAVRRYQGHLHITQASLQAGPEQEIQVQCNGENDLPDWRGVLRWVATESGGIAEAFCSKANISVRGRQGGEQFKLAANRPTRSLKAQCQAAAIAPWLRETTPLIYIDGQLAAMPGLGINHEFIAPAGSIGWTPEWHPYKPKV